MLYTKFRGNQSTAYGEDFERVLLCMDVVAYWSCDPFAVNNLSFLLPIETPQTNCALIGQAVSEKINEIVDDDHSRWSMNIRKK